MTNGRLELTDGTFIWPDGLAHYVRDHAVRLPATFVSHIQREIARWDYAETTTEWWTRHFNPSPDARASSASAGVPTQLAGREVVLGQLGILLRELEADPDSWENPTLNRYLEALGALLGYIENAYRNTGRPVPESAWQICADALAGAKYHE